MGYPYVAEGGAMPMVISGGNDDKSGIGGGGGVLVILLFVILLAVVGFAAFNRREPVVAAGGGLSEILPAMMVSQMAAQRQTVDVNSNNTNYGNCNPGPSNFQIYQQGVGTNDNVFVQACQTRELIIEDGQKTRDLINLTERDRLRDLIANQNLTIAMKDNQIQANGLYNSLSVQNINNFNGLERDIANLQQVVCKVPVNARLVDCCN